MVQAEEEKMIVLMQVIIHLKASNGTGRRGENNFSC